VLTPGRYVGATAADADDVPFEERFTTLKARLEEQFVEAETLAVTIRERLARVTVDG
jgi:type I restriction enzyme M protein